MAIVSAPLFPNAPETKTFRDWLKTVQAHFNVRAVVTVAREVYGKQGTTYPTKVLVIDMSEAEPAWRVVALMVTGILLVVTSVVYSRAGRAGA